MGLRFMLSILCFNTIFRTVCLFRWSNMPKLVWPAQIVDLHLISIIDLLSIFDTSIVGFLILPAYMLCCPSMLHSMHSFSIWGISVTTSIITKSIQSLIRRISMTSCITTGYSSILTILLFTINFVAYELSSSVLYSMSNGQLFATIKLVLAYMPSIVHSKHVISLWWTRAGLHAIHRAFAACYQFMMHSRNWISLS